MRRESADFIGARSASGCNKAGYRAAATLECQIAREPFANGRRSFSQGWKPEGARRTDGSMHGTTARPGVAGRRTNRLGAESDARQSAQPEILLCTNPRTRRTVCTHLRLHEMRPCCCSYRALVPRCSYVGAARSYPMTAPPDRWCVRRRRHHCVGPCR